MVILRDDLSGIWDNSNESSANLFPILGYNNFCLLGKTLVTSQILRFSSEIESSPQTRTVYSFPLHLTIRVISSSVTGEEDDDEAEEASIVEDMIDSIP